MLDETHFIQIFRKILDELLSRSGGHAESIESLEEFRIFISKKSKTRTKNKEKLEQSRKINKFQHDRKKE
jgi:hypothetical protein